MYVLQSTSPRAYFEFTLSRLEHGQEGSLGEDRVCEKRSLQQRKITKRLQKMPGERLLGMASSMTEGGQILTFRMLTYMCDCVMEGFCCPQPNDVYVNVA